MLPAVVVQGPPIEAVPALHFAFLVSGHEKAS